MSSTSQRGLTQALGTYENSRATSNQRHHSRLVELLLASDHLWHGFWNGSWVHRWRHRRHRWCVRQGHDCGGHSWLHRINSSLNVRAQAGSIKAFVRFVGTRDTCLTIRSSRDRFAVSRVIHSPAAVRLNSGVRAPPTSYGLQSCLRIIKISYCQSRRLSLVASLARSRRCLASRY